ncbi:coiled-coil domain-containing protein 112-like [Lampris incognitus]|uniref:coiled-coil domain-containing protein 112-like n=1 Tax=Lampris incognitus TaxID=2546036 RepID=UPI0024B5819F|nr:coiled-coil domain-containing protein 112-like [Lampris incognitus]
MSTFATARLAEKSRWGEGEFSTAPLFSGHHVEEKLAQQTATEFIKEADRMKQLIEKVEKEITLSVQSRKNRCWTDGFGELEEYEKLLREERNADKITIEKQLEKIHNGVRMFQRQLTDIKPSPKLIEKLKKIMSEVDISINTFKEDQCFSFEELLKEEKICCQQIVANEKKIEIWTLAVRSDLKMPTTTSVKVTKPTGRNLPPEVLALESFQQKTGGPYGGWDQYDHQVFLKAWIKHSGQPAYRREAKLYLPDKSLEEMVQHEQWYQELICLQDKKREAILRWKASRHQERQTRIESQEEVEEAENKEREAKTQARRHRDEEERKEAARHLEKWREKKKRKEEQEDEERLAKEMLQRRLAKEERRRQLEVKLTIEEQLRLRREEEVEQERKKREEELREMEKKSREAAVVIRQFHERDLHKVEVKLLEKQLEEQQETERQKRIAAKIKKKAESNISRDPSRLTQATKGWKERMKHIGPSGGGAALHMFHRAIPSWRQGL